MCLLMFLPMLPLVPALHAEPGASEKSLYPLESFELEGKLPVLKGNVVLLDFWASWCGPCAKSFPSLNAFYKEYRERGVIVLGVNVDEKRSAMDAFLKKLPVTFPVVRDVKQLLVSKVNVEGMPTSVLLDRTGVIRFRHVGFRGEETITELRKHVETLLKEE